MRCSVIEVVEIGHFILLRERKGKDMKVKKKWAAGPLAALMLVAGGFVGTAAQADEAEPTPVVAEAPAAVNETTIEVGPLAFPGCTLGWACVWVGDNYTGGSAAANYSGGYTWVSSPLSPAKALQNSAAANGNLCRKTAFYNTGGRYFVLNSQTRLGGTSRDPNLSNGAGNAGSTTMNWKNQVRSFEFFNGPNCV